MTRVRGMIGQPCSPRVNAMKSGSVSRPPVARLVSASHVMTIRNRHGSWRNGEGGALDASRPSEPEAIGGVNAAEPTESSKSDATPSWRALRRHATVRTAGGRPPRQRQRSQWDATPSPSPRLQTAHASGASRSFACMPH